MKHRDILIVFMGFLALAQMVSAEPTVAPQQPVDKPFQDLGGPDISQSSWQTPAAAMRGNLTSNSTASVHIDSTKLAATLDGGKPVQMEKTRSIEVEATATDSVTEQPPAMMAAAKPKGGSKKIVLIGGGCLALLAFRIFRRPSNIPKKPRFL